MPTGQFWQDVIAAETNFPAGHAVQEVAKAVGVGFENLPRSQPRHVLLPASFWYVPCWRQMVSFHDPFNGQEVPGRQFKHADESVDPLLPLYFPWAHPVQVTLPVMSW